MVGFHVQRELVSLPNMIRGNVFHERQGSFPQLIQSGQLCPSVCILPLNKKKHVLYTVFGDLMAGGAAQTRWICHVRQAEVGGKGER